MRYTYHDIPATLAVQALPPSPGDMLVGSDEWEHAWLPTLGPSVVCLAKHLHRNVIVPGELVAVEVADIGAAIGVYHWVKARGVVARMLNFDVASVVVPHGGLAVRTGMPSPTARQIERRAEHKALCAAEALS